MERQSVDSSMIAAIGYDAETQTVEVEFKRGAIWQYEGVPAPVYQAMMESESIGKYFNAEIKGQYPETEVG